MAYVVAAARVFARAAAIQLEEAAAAAGPVAVAKAKEASLAREREARQRDAAQLSAFEVVPGPSREAIHTPAPWASGPIEPPAVPTPRTLPLGTYDHHPPPPRLAPEDVLKPPAVKVAKVTKVSPQPEPALEIEPASMAERIEVQPALEVASDRIETTFPSQGATVTVDAPPTKQTEGIIAESRLPAIDTDVDDAPIPLRASAVPSSRLGRLFHYGCESLLTSHTDCSPRRIARYWSGYRDYPPHRRRRWSG